MSKFGKEVNDLCKKIGIQEARKVCNCLKENAWKVAFTLTKYLNVRNTTAECVARFFLRKFFWSSTETFLAHFRIPVLKLS